MKSAFIRRTRKLSIAALYALTPLTATAFQDLQIAPAPLFLGGLVEPNIMLTLDDSNSMGWSFYPSSLATTAGAESALWSLAPEHNSLAYNPTRDYFPPVDGSRASLPSAFLNYPKVPADGYAYWANVSPTCTVDLSAASYLPTWTIINPCGTTSATEQFHSGVTGVTGAFFVVRDTTSCTPSSDLRDDCYRAVALSDETVTDADRENFANWYAYYRTRLLQAKASLGLVFSKLSDTARVGLALMNRTNAVTDINGTEAQVADPVDRGIRIHSGANRTEFFERLYGLQLSASAESPFRTAYDGVGKYFQTAEPWLDNPAEADSGTLSCRQSYQVFTADGVWNGAGVSGDPGTNVDGSDGGAFADSWTGTLADVARYYYKTDLLGTVSNDVPATRRDPANWQHLVTIAVGFGLQDGSIDPDAAFEALYAGTSVAWPDPESSDPGVSERNKIDDLLHAAVNTYGDYVNVNAPDEITRVLDRVFRGGTGRAASAASVVLNASTLSGGTTLYQALFDSGDWSGSLIAVPICSGGSDEPSDPCFGVGEGQIGLPLWDTGDPAGNYISSKRTVTTRCVGTDCEDLSGNSTSGKEVVFACSGLSAEQRIALNCAVGDSLVNYLKGDSTNEERNGGDYRNRASLLGDIVNSTPAYVGAPKAGYPDTFCSERNQDGTCRTVGSETAYSAFVSSNATRLPRIYAGANDGMLHVIDASADGGDVLRSYVPSMVIPRLQELADPLYLHKYYVDGSPTVMDAFFGGAWHTVLVAGLGGGGQGVYALDVTDAGDTKMLWEFNEDSDAYSIKKGKTTTEHSDLGYTYSRPNVVRLSDGKWVALFGNGYDNAEADDRPSATGNAVLYVVDIATGALVGTGKGTGQDNRSGPGKIDVGPQDDPLSDAPRPNGLSTVAPVDSDNDAVVDFAYAGDLYGNLWKFDLSDPGSMTATKLFSAPAGQSITSRPQVIRHPTKPGYIVLFGTGSYFLLGESNPAGATTQAFYGVWDDLTGRVAEVENMTRQEILAEVESDNDPDNLYRVTTSNQVPWDNSDLNHGWYLPLVNREVDNPAGPPPDPDNRGERQISDSVVRGSRIVFSTLIPLSPGSDQCGFGGDGWLMELDAATGSALGESPFFFNNNSVYQLATVAALPYADGKTTGTAPSGRKSQVGIIPAPAILARPGGTREYKYLSGSKQLAGTTRNIEVVVESADGSAAPGRRSWSQLFK